MYPEVDKFEPAITATKQLCLKNNSQCKYGHRDVIVFFNVLRQTKLGMIILF